MLSILEAFFLSPMSLSLSSSLPTGALIDPTFYLSRTVSNVISSIVFGDRFDYEDKEFLSLLRMMLGSFQFASTSTGQVTCFTLSYHPQTIAASSLQN